MNSFKLWGAVSLILVLSVVLLSATAFASDGNDIAPPTVQVSDPVVPKLSPVMRNVVYVPPDRKLDREEINPIKNPGLFLPDFGLTGTNTKGVDPLVAVGLSPLDAPSPSLNFEGQGDFALYSPPDTTGDVGPNHFVQMVNVETAIYDKTGTLLSNFANNQLWAGFGGPCENDNSGDPIVLYDDMADRWLLSQFAVNTGQFMCLAISVTPDPTGAYYLYSFPMPDFPDYPKLGIWPDGYYLGTNTGYPNQYYAHVMDRASMLAGTPATMQSVGGQANFLMPADADGLLSPPSGDPGVFYTFFDAGYPNHPAGVDRLALFEFDVDWATPGNTTFALVQEIPITDFNYTTCGFFVRDCLDQLNTTNQLDAVDAWPMVRLQYRNLVNYQALVGNFTVDADGTDHAGIRWFELRKSGSLWSLYQEGTWAPDSHNRFMGSIAMDGSGNLALGYSITSATMYPSIRYTVHGFGDPAGTMQSEAELMAGGGSQTSSQRWGDYSATVVDPSDNCTFWITNMYHDVQDTGFSWNTRIGTFRFPGCTGSLNDTGMLVGTVSDSSTSDPIEDVSVSATLSVTETFTTSTDGMGDYDLTLPVGTYTVTASAFGYQPETVTAVDVISDSTTTLDFALTQAAFYLVSGTVTDATTGWPLYASIDIDGYPGDPIWTNPETGYYEISIPEGITYTFNVNAWVPGYLQESRNVGPLTGVSTEDFGLIADADTCNAPGYGYDVTGVRETFNDITTPTGWSVVNLGGTCEWTFDDPGERSNLTGGEGNFAIADSDECGIGTTMSTTLMSPIVDISSLGSVDLNFRYDYNNLSSSEIAAVDISADGGSNWTNLAIWNTDQRGPATYSQDVTAFVSGSTQAQLRFRYYAPSWDWWWEVDDVLLGEANCEPSSGGLVVGNIYDDNTNDPLNGAMVENEAGYVSEAVATPFDDSVDDGFYTVFSPSGSQVFTATLDVYTPDVDTIAVTAGDTVGHDFFLEAGWLSVDPTGVEVILAMGDTTTEQITLDNNGTINAAFEIKEDNNGFLPTVLLSMGISPPQMVVRERLAGFDENATSTAGILSGGGTPVMSVLAAGDVLNQWSTGQTLSWGDGFDLSAGTVWINDNAAGGGTGLNEEFTVDGSLTGASFTPSFGGTWPGDMAYNPNTGMFWQINVGGDNCIHEWDPSIPAATGSSICGATWTATSQRGLAWDPTDDSFFIGGWNEFIIYHVASDGSIVEQWNTGLSISGLAYNWQAGQLFVIENSATDTISQFDVASGAVVNSFAVTGFGSNAGAGLAIDCDGNLWAANQLDNNAYLIDSGVPASLCYSDIPWLTENPISGVVNNLGDITVDLDFDAGVPEVDQPGTYLGSLVIENDSPYDRLSVPVTMTVEAPNTWGKLEGTVTGLGYCDASPMELEDAEVTITDSGGVTYTLMTDSNGYYSRWFAESLGTFDIEVTYPEYQDGNATGVVVSAGGTTTQDFDLRWLEPCMSVDPTSLEITLVTGYSETVELDVVNAGALGTGFEVLEKEGSYGLVSQLIAIPEFVGKIPENSVPVSMSRSPDATRQSGDDPSIFFPLAGESAYAMDVYPGENLVNIPDTTLPGTWNVVGNISGSQYFAGDFVNGDFSTLYVIDYGTNSLYQVDTATSIPTLIGPSPPSSGYWSGATGSVEGTFYASSADCGTVSYLHTIDVVTGAVTLVGTITNGPCIIDIAINANGELYGVDIVNDSLVAIDPATGAGTVIGALGVDANYAQGMDFEEETGVLYWAAYTTQGELRIIDTTTGASTLVGAFSGGAEVDCFAFATGGSYSDIPWLSTDPITGTLAADSVQTIDVTFDTMTYTVGTYTGTLMVKTDDSVYDKIEVPVTMHVEAISYGVEVVAESDSLSGEPGSVVTYTVWMTNTGNVLDGYDMAAGSHNWAMDMPTSMDPIAPAESHSMQVSITIPIDAGDGDSDLVTITVASQGDPTVTAAITLTTRAVIPVNWIYLPLIFR